MALAVPLGPDDVSLLREVRLRSLVDAPDAFTSTYEREVTFDEDTWRSRLETCRWFVAIDDGPGPPVGVAGGLPSWSEAPDVRQLVAMWVDPDHRRLGVAGVLLAAVAGWASADGARRLVLEVRVENGSARAFYRRAGLVPTGTGHHALPGGGSAAVEVLELAL